MKRVIELIRVSTESQAAADRASIPAQRAVNQRTARSYGLTIVRSIEISDVSGAAVLMAPEIRQLLLLISDPNIHGVVTREFSRLMRPEDFSDYALLQTFADSNTLLWSGSTTAILRALLIPGSRQSLPHKSRTWSSTK